MPSTKVLNCRLNKTLTDKLKHIKKSSGLDSDAECVRYLINLYEFMVIKPQHSNEDEIDAKIERTIQKIEKSLPKYIEKKFKGKLPSLNEQHKRLTK